MISILHDSSNLSHGTLGSNIRSEQLVLVAKLSTVSDLNLDECFSTWQRHPTRYTTAIPKLIHSRKADQVQRLLFF